MIDIKKSSAPMSLGVYRSTYFDACYDNLKIKEEIKQSLLNEQGDICAYCMSRVSIDTSQIEHYLPRRHHADKELDYSNMLAVCTGKTGKDEHCDTSKGSQYIKYNPSESGFESKAKIRYGLRDGKISSDDNEFDKQLNEILNLNANMLNINRQKVVEGIMEGLSKLKKVNKGEITRMINNWNTFPREPFCGVAIYYLNKKLKAAK